MKLNPHKKYSRINSTLIENGVEILKFLQEFPVNIEEFNQSNIAYHEKYISSNPGLVEWLIEEEDMLDYYSEDIKDKKDTLGRTAMQHVSEVDDEEMQALMGDLTEDAASEIPSSTSETSIATKDDKTAEIPLVTEMQEVRPDPTLSRKEQVRWYIDHGDKSPSSIAKKLGTNASYVQRLKKEIENEEN